MVNVASMCPFRMRFERPGGIVSGQVFMAAADVAMWLAIKTKLGLTHSSVTAEMKTTFLGRAKRTELCCTAKVLKLGRQLIYGVAECVDARASYSRTTPSRTFAWNNRRLCPMIERHK